MHLNFSVFCITYWILYSSDTTGEFLRTGKIHLSNLEPTSSRIKRSTTIDCAKNNGGCDQHCGTSGVGYLGDNYCYCNPSFSLGVDQITCHADKRECLARQDCKVECEHDQCACPSGLQANGQRCIDIDECYPSDGGTHGCGHTCINTYGSYYCECPALGMRLNINGTSCEDINECVENSNICEHTCENTHGSFTCSCREGYQLHARVHCTAINYCSINNGGCSEKCIQHSVGYECKCDSGKLHKDGKTCLGAGHMLDQCYDLKATKHLRVKCKLRQASCDNGHCYKDKICVVTCIHGVKAETRSYNKYYCGKETDYKWKIENSKHKLICTKKFSNPSYKIVLRFIVKTRIVYHSSVENTNITTKRVIRLFKGLKGFKTRNRYQVRNLHLSCYSSYKKYAPLLKRREKTVCVKFVLKLRSLKSTRFCRKKCIRKKTKAALENTIVLLNKKLENNIKFRMNRRKGIIMKGSLKKGKIKRTCRKGHILLKSLCLACQPGTYLRNKRCLPCPFGTYQNKRAQLECLSCGPEYRGRDVSWGDQLHIGATSKLGCQDYCGKGSFSINGLLPCEACPKGTYQPKEMSMSCVTCPRYYAWTKATGSISHLQCYDIEHNNVESCDAGSYFKGNTCRKCPVLQYQPDSGQNFCKLCPNTTSTDKIGSTDLSQCKDHRCSIIDSKAQQGEIRSPNWPSSFPANSKCNWNIRTKSKRLILLFFNKLSFPKRYNCSDLKISIKHQGLRMKICSNSIRPIINLNSSRVQISFSSKSNSHNYKGFSLFYVSYSSHYRSLIESIVTDHKLYTQHKIILQDRNLLSALLSLIKNPTSYYLYQDTSTTLFQNSFRDFITEKVRKFILKS